MTLEQSVGRTAPPQQVTDDGHAPSAHATAPLPEALARFAPAAEPAPGHPLRPVMYVAVAVDTFLILASLAVGTAVWGSGHSPLLPVILILVFWVGTLAMFRAYDPSRMAVGSDEFKNVISATIAVFALIATVAYATDHTGGRVFVIGTFVAGLFLLPVGRRTLRSWVFHRRRSGHMLRRTLVIGDEPQSAELVAGMTRDKRAGFEVVRVLAGPPESHHLLDGWLDQVEAEIAENRVDAVTVAQCPTVDSEVIRRLSWRLEGPSVDLLVAPALGDVSGPRLNVRPAAGLPLLHLEEPRLTGPQSAIKRAVDLLVATLGLILLLPALVIVGLCVRVTSRGPAFFIQDRIGRAGTRYRMVKFRTMHDGSDKLRSAVLGDAEVDPEAYRNDPRITPLGQFLRRWSLDEVPQLWNVVTGSMSLVGPRPMLPEELPLLGTTDHRRHLTKPGLTGLWQVSGRKDVAWSERMQMDLRYVEQWSPTLDFVILAKTVKAVAAGSGAH